ncbi:MAG: exodeoxyribonuclease III [Acidimicrobiales bacterium]|nr:exodeoxyribonuclease III [Acidimicrobiales bacterium]
MRLATWNVNSLKVRMERVEEWLRLFSPDVLCMQETKLADDAFPGLFFETLGYQSVHVGQGQWNGVAILSRVGIDDVEVGLVADDPPDAEARAVWATCGGVRVASCYVPNGRAVGHDHYHYKLRWLERLRRSLDERCDPGTPTAVMGDFNIAPDDRDVWSPAAFDGATHVSGPEREAYARILDWGLEDVFRRHHDEAGLYSWWDYRDGAFHKRMGLRIDLVLVTRDLAAASTRAFVDRNARKGKQPSDHAPVVVDLDLP